MYKLIFFVPATHLNQVKQALFAVGGGQSSKYAACCWEVLGTFQYKPLANSNPAMGTKGELAAIAEYRVEMVCSAGTIENVLQTLLSVHPYEEPAYEIDKLCQSLSDLK